MKGQGIKKCKLNGKGLRFDILLREVDQYVCLCRSVCGAGEFWVLDKGIQWVHLSVMYCLSATTVFQTLVLRREKSTAYTLNC